MKRPALRLAYHRSTTAHVASLYPFAIAPSFGHRGPLVGVDLLAGSAPFHWDPFESYATGHITNPNCWVVGEPGNGKSALVKTLLWRQHSIYAGSPAQRWLAIADPKGEYAPLAKLLDLEVIRLEPGGPVRVNPLAPGPATNHEPDAQLSLHQAEMCTALVATVLGRRLTQVEDALLFAAVEHLLRADQLGEPTLVDLAHVLSGAHHHLPTRLQLAADEATEAEVALGFAVDKLLNRSLRGMFDGPTTIPLDWAGPGIVLDLSAVPLDSDALPLVMVAAAGWLQQLMSGPGPQRIQVVDEAWALLRNQHTASYLQSCFKLGRTYGVANICITHRASDLVAQADDGSATVKIAAGLLADSATKVLLRQAPDQLASVSAAFGLTETETNAVGHLTRGRSLWKTGSRTALVDHLISPAETQLCDTDARMHGPTWLR